MKTDSDLSGKPGSTRLCLAIENLVLGALLQDERFRRRCESVIASMKHEESGALAAPAKKYDDRKLFTLSGAAKELGVSFRTVHRMVASGRVKVVRVAEGGHPFINGAELSRISGCKS